MNRTLLILISFISFGTLAGHANCSPVQGRPATQQQTDYCSNPPQWLGQNTQLELEINERVNAERAQQGLAPLQLNAQLNVAAQRHAINMGCQGVMAHNLDGQDAGQRMNAAGYSWSAWAENVAMGYTSAPTVVAGWMNSPGHRANILDESSLDLTETGIGAFTGPDGRIYYCQVFARPGSR